MLRKIIVSLFSFILWSISNQVLALENGFVYLHDIDANIIQSLRYYSIENFTGRIVDGYKANKVILTKEAAQALSKVRQELFKDGYFLVVYDAYRPRRAVNWFIKWSEDSKDQIKKESYYPSVNKADVFKLGYVVEKSGHSRGSTVDISIIKIKDSLKEVDIQKRILLNGSVISFLDDGTVDMGSSFDLFHESSHHDNNLIETKFLERRNYLRNIMQKYGFDDYKEEWWHYTLRNEPFPDTYFDFVIE